MVSPMVSLEVGQRCCCDGFFATVRFVGEVPPSKGSVMVVLLDEILQHGSRDLGGSGMG